MYRCVGGGLGWGRGTVRGKGGSGEGTRAAGARRGVGRGVVPANVLRFVEEGLITANTAQAVRCQGCPAKGRAQTQSNADRKGCGLDGSPRFESQRHRTVPSSKCCACAAGEIAPHECPSRRTAGRRAEYWGMPVIARMPEEASASFISVAAPVLWNSSASMRVAKSIEVGEKSATAANVEPRARKAMLKTQVRGWRKHQLKISWLSNRIPKSTCPTACSLLIHGRVLYVAHGLAAV